LFLSPPPFSLPLADLQTARAMWFRNIVSAAVVGS
jgi:hypothetical protein